jgi:hypothetical protein
LNLYPTSHPAGGVQVLQKAWNLQHINALDIVDLGPERPFSVSECALWARLSGSRFAAQVAAAISLVEAPANHRKASTVAKEVMVIMLGNKKGPSIEKFFESPFAG